jgi:hypothetical protein
LKLASTKCNLEEIWVVTSNVQVEFSEGKRNEMLHSVPCKMGEEILRESLGGDARGLLAVALPRNPTTGCPVWKEATVYVQSKNLAQVLCTRLEKGISGLRGEIAAVKATRGNRPLLEKARSVPMSGRRAKTAGELKTPSLEIVKSIILAGVHERTRTFPLKTKSGDGIQWVAKPAIGTEPAVAQTTFADLAPLDEEDLASSADLRAVLLEEEAPIETAAAFEALKQLNKEEVIVMCVAESGDCYEIWSKLRWNVAESERRAQPRDAAASSESAQAKSSERGDGGAARD